MMAVTTIEVYMMFIGLILFAILAVFIVYAEASGEKEHKKKAKEERRAEASEINPEKRSEEESPVTIVVSEPSPAEQALLAANRQSLQMSMGALEAHRLLAEAARRHEYDPAPAAWYTDAEWNVQP